MENASLLSVAAENVTTSLFKSDDVANYLTNIRDLVLKVIYIIIGTVGVVDNLFVIVVFLLFIKITDKVFLTTVYILKHLKTCSKLCQIMSSKYSRIVVDPVVYFLL